MQMQGFGADEGWHYRLGKDGTLNRELSPEDCPCNNHLRHQLHLEALRRIEEIMQRFGIKQISERLFELNSS